MKNGTHHHHPAGPAGPATADGQAAEMPRGHARRKNKKDEIVRLAMADPFMSVDEIAVKVGTTPRYVRTILSEAGLSLLALRRRYARQMEERLGLDVRVARGGQGLARALRETGSRLETSGLRVAQVRDPEIAVWLDVDPETPLLEVSRVRTVDGRPFYVNQVVTRRELTVHELVPAEDTPLREALGFHVAGEASLAERTLDVIPASKYLAQSLHVEPGTPVLRSGNVIRVGSQRVAVEFNYFDATRVRLVLEGVPDYALRIVERFSDEPAAREANGSPGASSAARDGSDEVGSP